jgi:PAS domain S-box-containing protein/putative nucleotidyltransferase with HDIG domain
VLQPQIKQTAWLIIGLWTFAVLVFLSLNIRQQFENAETQAKKVARASLNKDQAFRQWVTVIGGLYGKVDKVEPSPHLAHIANRDIKTDVGDLTLLNPAYILRLVMDNYSELYGIKGRITGFKTLNPNNTPDAWEKKALTYLEQNQHIQDYVELISVQDKNYMRMMTSMYMSAGCMACHAKLGYNVGEFRGGVNVSIPMSDFYSVAKKTALNLSLSYGGIWILGLLGIVIISRRALVNADLRDQSYEKLNQITLKLKHKTNELETSKKHFQKLFNDAPLAYQSLDDEGMILNINKQWQTLTGCNESAIGKYIGDFISPQTIQFLEVNFSRFKQHGHINNAEWEIVNQTTGEVTPIRVYGNINYDDDNEIEHNSSLLYDLTTEKKQERKLKENYESIIEIFVNIIEEKDVYTAGHSKRVAKYSQEIAKQMKCTKQELENIFRAGQLHDIGKIVTPESILLKPNKFTKEEYLLMKEHVESGYAILSQISDYNEIAIIMRHHHERYDGTAIALR